MTGRKLAGISVGDVHEDRCIRSKPVPYVMSVE